MNLKFEIVLLKNKVVVLQVKMIGSSECDDEFSAAVFLQHKEIVLLQNITAKHRRVGATGLAGKQPIECYAE